MVFMITLYERLKQNKVSSQEGSYCCNKLKLQDTVWIDTEFNNDATYCSQNCLSEH